ncbi:hypothetical protein [Fimbriiglobus ruber]|uniref:Uncharacterized protein n=1 Tax=Fimbriiglobus ruber TaxID=1908690 RepID=A0A225E8A9_9BACT|nr:hypothetical protein [Fimbriiglobus ruber]OWK45739.1 hypothetical protein FRUB_02070 [Fimbriiglobus ruber]
MPTHPTAVAPPAPTTLTSIQIVVIEDTAAAAADRAAWFTDKDLVGFIAARQFPHPVVAASTVVDESGHPPADLAPYLTRAAGKSLPYLFLVGAKGSPQAGKVAFEGPLPATPADLLKLLKSVTGERGT